MITSRPSAPNRQLFGRRLLNFPWLQIPSRLPPRWMNSWLACSGEGRFDHYRTRRLSLAAVSILVYLIGICVPLSSQNAPPVPPLPPPNNPASPSTNEEQIGFCRKCGNNSARDSNPKTKCKEPATADHPARIVPCPNDDGKCDPSDPNCKQSQPGSSVSGDGSSAGGGSATGGGGGASGGPGSGGSSGGGGGSQSPPQQQVQLWYLVDASWFYWSKNNPPGWKPGLGSVGISWGIMLQELSANAASVQSAARSSDYHEVVLPSVQAAVAPAKSSDFARAGFAAVNAIGAEASDFRAFSANYSRYLGAKQANDPKAMLQLANALVQLSDRTGQDADKAGAAIAKFQQMLLPIVQQISERAKKQGTTWDGDVARIKAKLPQGLPKDTESEIAATGATPEQIAAFKAAGTSMTAEQIKTAIRPLLDANAAKLPREEPPQKAAVEGLKSLASRLQTEAQQSMRARAASASVGSPHQHR